MKRDGHTQQTKYVIGIDEVGRGPIAGAVAVGAFLIPMANLAQVKKYFRGVKESKQLTEAQREEWFTKIEQAKLDKFIDFRVSFQSEKVIDTKGLSYAIKTALKQSLIGLVNLDSKIAGGATSPADYLILLDGGLKAPPEFIHQKTIIKGDVKELSIALASITAKVLRDRRMHLLARKYPQYGFNKHKGYGTRSHYEAIRTHGLTPIHRRSFLKKL